MRIHFICTGNIYRSRMAEAYCASRRLPGIRVFSSGIAAGVNGDAPISLYAADVLASYGLSSFAAKRWRPTTAALVKMSDVLILMESEHHRFCADWIEPARQRVEVWGIEDIGPIKPEEIPEKVDRTFKIIRERTDALLLDLKGVGIERKLDEDKFCAFPVAFTSSVRRHGDEPQRTCGVNYRRGIPT